MDRRTLIKLRYYTIFFVISGIVHYYTCFDHPQEIKKIKLAPEKLAMAPGTSKKVEATGQNFWGNKIEFKPVWEATGGLIRKDGTYIAGLEVGVFYVRVRDEETEVESEIEVKIIPVKPKIAAVKIPKIDIQNKKKPIPKPIKKKKLEKTEYQENLEKKLREEFTAKKQELEKQKQELDKLKKDFKKDLKKTKEEDEKQKKLNQQLTKQLTEKLAQLTKQMQNMKRSKNIQDKEIDKKMRELERQNKEKLAKMEKEAQKDLQRQRQKNELKQKKLDEAEKKFRNMALRYNSELAKTRKEREDMKRREREMQKHWKKFKANKKRVNDELKKVQSEMDKLKKEKENQKRLAQQIIRDQKRLEQLKNAPRKNRKEEKKIRNRQWKDLKQVKIKSLKQHQEYVRRFKIKDRGVVVPTLNFFDDYFVENMKKVMKFHGMKLIGYPDSQHYFISVNLDGGRNNNRYRKRTDFNYIKQFNNRAIFAEDALRYIVREIIQDRSLYHPNDGKLFMTFLLPHQTANYMAWKSVTVCKKFGYDPKKVEVCNGIFKRTRHGYWSLIIKSLDLKNGKRVEVDDFEEKW